MYWTFIEFGCFNYLAMTCTKNHSLNLVIRTSNLKCGMICIISTLQPPNFVWRFFSVRTNVLQKVYLTMRQIKWYNKIQIMGWGSFFTCPWNRLFSAFALILEVKERKKEGWKACGPLVFNPSTSGLNEGWFNQVTGN